MKLFVAFILLAVFAIAHAFEDISVADSYNLLQAEGVYLLDVRTDAEWTYVGHPGVNKVGEGAFLTEKVFNISVKIHDKDYNLVDNKHFVKDTTRLFKAVTGVPAHEFKSNIVIIAMCRSGSRGEAAALLLEEAGYANVYNMVDAFEGSKDENGYRTVNGWKVEGYPYTFGNTGVYLK